MSNDKSKQKQVNGVRFTIKPQYKKHRILGAGSFGTVASVTNTETDQKMAVKKITPAFSSRRIKHALREVRIMRYLGEHPNIISARDLSTNETDDELYIYMDLMEADLTGVLRSRQVLSEHHIRYLMYQLLQGVDFCHDAGIIHRDLKPGNILVNSNCDLRISDFGMARLQPKSNGDVENEEEMNPAMTQHVVTRWYRPPELMLQPDGMYSSSVDMWSVGCIIAELLLVRPLFPGKNFVHQLNLILDVLGVPAETETNHIKNQRARDFLKSLKGKRRINFDELFPNASTAARDLVEKLLVFDPKKRLTAKEALMHEFFEPVRAKIRRGGLKNLREGSRGRYSFLKKNVNFDFENDGFEIKEMQRLLKEEVIMADQSISEKNDAPLVFEESKKRESDIRTAIRSLVKESKCPAIPDEVKDHSVVNKSIQQSEKKMEQKKPIRSRSTKTSSFTQQQNGTKKSTNNLRNTASKKSKRISSRSKSSSRQLTNHPLEANRQKQQRASKLTAKNIELMNQRTRTKTIHKIPSVITVRRWARDVTVQDSDVLLRRQ